MQKLHFSRKRQKMVFAHLLTYISDELENHIGDLLSGNIVVKAGEHWNFFCSIMIEKDNSGEFASEVLFDGLFLNKKDGEWVSERPKKNDTIRKYYPSLLACIPPSHSHSCGQRAEGMSSGSTGRSRLGLLTYLLLEGLCHLEYSLIWVGVSLSIALSVLTILRRC